MERTHMASSLLSNFLAGSEKTPSLLVQDSSSGQGSGRLLLTAIALSCRERFSGSHVFLFNVQPHSWLGGLPTHLRDRLTVHDCFTDHLGWRTGSSPAPLHEATPTSFIRAIGETTPSQLSDHAVVIDSLSPLLDFHTSGHICHLIHLLGRGCGLVACLVHSDLHESHVIQKLSHVMSTVIDVTDSTTTGQFKVRVQHHRNSGKLLVSNELVSIGNCYEVSSSPLITASHTSPSPLAPDPTLNLTFDLTLSEREREERGQLVLPYHHSTRKKTALLEAGSGRIFYQPDEADDYDDSDPDDDLDI